MAGQPIQFRLRTLMIVVAILAVPCAFVHFTQQQTAVRAAVLERAKELGGKAVWFEDGGRRNLELIALPPSTKVEDRRAIQAAFPDVPVFPLKADGNVLFDDGPWSTPMAPVK